MADKKDAPPAENGHDVMWQVVGFVLILLVLGTALSRTKLPERFADWQNNNSELIDGGNSNSGSDSTSGGSISSGDFGVFGALFPSGEIGVGDEVSNKGEVIVRAEPGGQILGTQKARAKALVLDGPVEKFQKTWWRVDYKVAPDGWITGSSVTGHTGWFSALNIIPTVFDILRPFLIFLAIVLVVLILFVVLKMIDLNRSLKKKKDYENEHEILKSRSASETSADEEVDDLEIPNLPIGDVEVSPRTESVKNRRWANIQSLINSHNTNDWKQAILEADMILDEMLDKMQYKGAGVGEKLKQVEKSDFITLDEAWEAHKIRNRVAHGGTDWVLSLDEAEKAISLYKKVFEEFYFI